MGIKVILVWSEELCCVTMFTHTIVLQSFGSLRTLTRLAPTIFTRMAESGFAPHRVQRTTMQ